MTRAPTQADMVRAVKAVIRAHMEMGLVVTGTKTTFVQGLPSVDVTVSPESSPPPGPVTGEDNAKELKKRIKRLHARGS